MTEGKVSQQKSGPYPCMISDSGQVYRQHQPDCPKVFAAVPPAADAGPRQPRFDDFDDPSHPAHIWWEKYGQYMMAGGGRKEYIWACRGWIAREQLAQGVEVTGDSMHEATPPVPQEAAPRPLVSVNEPRFNCSECGSSVAESYRSQHVCESAPDICVCGTERNPIGYCKVCDKFYPPVTPPTAPDSAMRVARKIMPSIREGLRDQPDTVEVLAALIREAGSERYQYCDKHKWLNGNDDPAKCPQCLFMKWFDNHGNSHGEGCECDQCVNSGFFQDGNV